MDLRNLKRRPKTQAAPPAAPTNIVRGPWDRPPEKPARRLKEPVWRRPAARRSGREPMVNNWGRLVLLLGLLFLLPPVATWLVHRLAQLASGG
jgi:hypothetical protein